MTAPRGRFGPGFPLQSPMPKDTPKRHLSLRHKLILLSVALATASAALVGGFLVWQAYGNLRRQSQQAQLALARGLADRLSLGLHHVALTVGNLARRPNFLGQPKGPLETEFSLVTAATELIDNLQVLLPDGRLWLRNQPGMTRAELPPTAFFLVQIRRLEVPGRPLVTGSYRTRDGRTGLVVSALVRAGGRARALLSAVFFPSFHGFGKEDFGRIGEEGSALIVDGKGLALAGPAGISPLADLAGDADVEAALAKGEGLCSFRDSSGDQVLSAFARVEPGDLRVVIRQPASQVYLPAGRMLVAMIVVLYVALVGTGVLAARLSGWAVEPLNRLTRQVGQAESGGAPLRTLNAYPEGDEVGLLARTLARSLMARDRQRRQRERALRRALQSERRLAEAEKLAALGQMSARLAHELNNPLAVIQGAAQMASREAGQAALEWLKEIDSESGRCKRLVRDLLDFTRPLRLEPRPTDLGALAAEAWNHALQGQPAAYRLRLPVRKAVLRVDPERFKQVFLNLFTNSMQAMPKGGTVGLDFRRHRAGWRLVVRDQGPGFQGQPPENLFKPFFSTKPRGSGLGLAIARSIVEAHGGSITASRARPRGALFAIRLPRTPRASFSRSGS